MSGDSVGERLSRAADVLAKVRDLCRAAMLSELAREVDGARLDVEAVEQSLLNGGGHGT